MSEEGRILYYNWPIQEEELATRSYREVADNEMDLWIKVTKQLFAPSFGQLKLSFSNFKDIYSFVNKFSLLCRLLNPPFTKQLP